MSRPFFARSISANDNLDIFLLSAVSSLLLLRLYLQLTGFPQVGGGTFHIAHMLWGGLLMLAAITINISFLGRATVRLSALVGGAGFGIFIDELGKFITKNNDYFFHPTIGIIYAIFVILYLTFNFLGRRQKLTTREYQLNALIQLEQAVLHDMDPTEKQAVAQLLDEAGSDTLTLQLKHLLDNIKTVPDPAPSVYRRFTAWTSKQYEQFWRERHSRQLVRWFFIAEAALFLIAVLVSVYANLDDIANLLASPNTASRLLVGQLLSASVAAGFAVYGGIILTRDRTEAYEAFRRATLVNLYLTQVFAFARIQFAALPGFFFSLALLLLINYARSQERQH